MKLAVLFFGLFCVFNVYAQSDFRQGNIITNEQDTIFGKIDFRADKLMSSVCTFQSGFGEKKYYPKDILSYRIDGENFYISKRIGEKHVFLEYLVAGAVDFYYYRDENGDHYLVGKQGMEIMDLSYKKKEVKKIEGNDYFFEPTMYRAVLISYMKDAPSLQSKIAKFKKPNHDNLVELAKEYHDIKSAGAYPIVIYSKKLPKTKVYLEILGGFGSLQDEFTLERKYSEFGVVGHFWIPRFSKRFYLRTGFVYSENKYLERKLFLPFQVEYMGPDRTKFRPMVAYGVNYSLVGFATVARIGFNWQLVQKFAVSLNYELEFSSSFPLIPKDVYSRNIVLSIITGLFKS